MTESMPPAPMAPPPAVPVTGRPMGATIVAIIEGILGVLFLLAALAAIGLMGIAGGLVGSSGVEGGAAAAGVLAGVGFIIGIIVLALGLLYLAIAYGVWKGRGWSWMLGVVVSIVALVLGVLGLTGGISVQSLIGVVLPIVVIYYLWQPDVKRWLGRPA